MAKIFVRERRHVGQGDGRPRLAVVGVEGSDLRFFRYRVRQAELDAIAQAIGAEVVMLPRGSGERSSQGGGGGRRHRRQQNRD
jgi:hypothetical protein